MSVQELLHRLVAGSQRPVAGQLVTRLARPARPTPALAAALLVRHASFATPVLALTHASLPAANPTQPASLAITGGTVWILARALIAGAPDASYVGVTVTGGTVGFGHATTTASDGAIVLAGALDLTLDCAPGDPRTAPPAGHAAAAITPPGHCKITWRAGVASIDAGSGVATCYGTSFAASGATTAFAWDDGLDAVTVRYTEVTPAQLGDRVVVSPIAELAGATTLRPAWALPVTAVDDPAVWTEATGPGWWVLAADQALTLRWRGASAPVTLASARLIVDRAQLWLLDAGAHGGSHELALWQAGAQRAPLRLAIGATVVFGSGADGDVVQALCTVELGNTPPIDAAGQPLAVGRVATALVTLRERAAALGVELIAVRAATTRRRTLVLRNALLAAGDPASLALSGTSPDGVDVEGTLRLDLPCWGWVPTLPDPYVSSGAALPGIFVDDGSAAPLRIAATLGWKAGQPVALDFAGTLGAPATVPATGALPDVPPLAAQPAPSKLPTQVGQGRAQLDTLFQGPPTHVPKPADLLALAADIQARLVKLELELGRAAAVPEAVAPVRLLDVSGARDHIGVAIGAGDGFTLSGSDVTTPLANVHAFMLPQVQWEPIRTLDIDQLAGSPFPRRLDFLDDGGPTSLRAATRTLVATVPELVVDAVVAAQPSAPVTLATTLPFGLAATVNLMPARGDRLAIVAPAFQDAAGDVTGARQLAVTAGAPIEGAQSPGFTGALRQIPGVGLFDRFTAAVIGPLAALDADRHPTADSVEQLLTDGFAAAVPVTRLDVMGRGGACFSTWTDPEARHDIAKVQLQVLVGRTALEIVKAVTTLLPWGIVVTRTVTIERRGGGGVIRRDSGWQAATAGVFRFPPTATTPAYPYPVEPGVLRGLFDVTNIRLAGGAPIDFTTTAGEPARLVPQLFDARVALDGHAAPVAATGVLGFLQVAPEGLAPLAAADLQRVFDFLRDPDTGEGGAVGGPIDAELELAGTGLGFRARRVEVDMHDGTLVGAIRGAPVFAQPGAWGVARRRRDAGNVPDDAVGVEQARGVPVVGLGTLDPARSTPDQLVVAGAGPLWLRDPVDLHRTVADARAEYGLLLSSPAHAWLYPDPMLVPGSRAIASASPPEFADVLLRSTSKGLFPGGRQRFVLPAVSLPVDDRGRFVASAAWTAPPGDTVRTIAADGSRALDYAAAALQLVIEPEAWRFELTGLAMWSDIIGVPRALGATADVLAGSDRTPVLADVRTRFGGSLSDKAGEVASWFLPPAEARTVELTASNAPFEIVLQFGLAFSTGRQPHDARPEPEPGHSEPPELEFELEIQERLGLYSTTPHAALEWSSLFGLELGLHIPFGLYEVIIAAGFEWEHGRADSFEVRVMIGLGVQIPDNPICKLSFEARVGAIFAVEDHVFGVGYLMALSFELAFTPLFPIVSIGMEAELASVYFPGVTTAQVFEDPANPLSPRTEFGDKLGTVFTGPGTYALGHFLGLVHVEVLFVFSISVEFEQNFVSRSA